MRLSRGAVVTASVGDPAGKPRPFVVLRSDHFAEHALVTLVIDRIVSVHMERIGEVIGQLADVDLTAITHAVAVYLGIADPLRRARRKRA